MTLSLKPYAGYPIYMHGPADRWMRS